MNDAPNLRVEDACEWLGVGRSTLYAYVQAGRITPHKAGRNTLFKMADLRALLDRTNPDEMMRAGLHAERLAMIERAAQAQHGAR